MLAAPSAALAEPYVFIGGGYGDVYLARDDGSGMVNLTGCSETQDDCGYYGPSAISPTRQTIAASDGYSKIDLMTIDGRNKRTLVEDSEARAYYPSFSSDGRLISFQAESDKPNDGYDIFTMRVTGDHEDGSDRKLLVGGSGDQGDADFSPDGERLAYIDYDAAGEDHLYVAELDALPSDRGRLIDLAPTITGAIGEPRFSPDGEKIVFMASAQPFAWPENPDQDWELWSVRVDGTGLERLTDDDYSQYSPEWTPDGQRVFYDESVDGYQIWSMALGGGDRRRVLQPSPEQEEELSGNEQLAAFMEPSQLIDGADRQAALFRPELLFDSGEPWRPLNIDTFLGERLHRVCVPAGCQPIERPTDLRPFESGGNIDVFGSGGPENYFALEPECNVNGLRDCDEGPNSAIYYHVTAPSPGGYRYLNYWFYHRFNDAPLEAFDHEGDWESVSVAPSPTGQTFDFATFSEHGKKYAYLRGNLRCDSGENDSCGSDEERQGHRVSVFVASGTHANYAFPCTNSAGPPATVCLQSNYAPETSHGGEAKWGRHLDDPADSMIEFPPTRPTFESSWTDGPKNWVDWPGAWGITNEAGSPGTDREMFWTPWAGTECASVFGCEREEVGTMGAAGSDPAADSRMDNSEPMGCGDWFGSGVSVLACDEQQLRGAMDAGRLDKKGDFSADASGDTREATAPGLAQTLGRPLRSGDRIEIEGDSADAESVLVRIEAGGRLYELEYALSNGAGQRPSSLQVEVEPRLGKGAFPRVVLKGPADTKLEPRAGRSRPLREEER